MLASLFIVAYNQREWIAEAIQHALRQDYDPLEIVVSDDCSTDGTWAVIQETVAGYSGPHRVRIRRNPINLGLADHINAVWKECAGEWIFAAAGDDRSHPSRVSRTIGAVKDRPRVTLVQTWVNEIDEAGGLLHVNRVGTDLQGGWPRTFDLTDRLLGNSPHPFGAAMAYSRRVVDLFGPLPRAVYHEDSILNLRADLAGESLVLPEPLVDHRNHARQIGRVPVAGSPDVQRAHLAARLASSVSVARQNLRDLDLARDWLEPTLHSRAVGAYTRRARYFERKERALVGRGPRRLLDLAMILLAGSRIAVLRRDDVALSILPGTIYLALKRLRERLIGA